MVREIRRKWSSLEGVFGYDELCVPSKDRLDFVLKFFFGLDCNFISIFF